MRLSRPNRSTVAAVVLSLIAFAGAAWVSTEVFDRLPHVEDEVAFLFQGRVIAQGLLAAPAPALPDFFSIPFVMVRDGLWFGKYPPGYPAALAPGVLAGAPWLTNPFFGALCVGLIYLLGKRLFDRQTGLIAAALAVVSPFFLLQAGSFLSHVVSLFWALAFAILFMRSYGDGSRRAAVGAGLAIGMLFLTRPLTAIGIALPFVLWTTWEVAIRRRRLTVHLLMLAGFLPCFAAYLGYNALTTGHAFLSGYALYWPYDRVGFGPGVGTGEGHTLQIGLINAERNLTLLADFLFGWPSRLSAVPAILATVVAIAGLLRQESGAVRAHISYRAPKGVPPADAQSAIGDYRADLLLGGVVAGLAVVHLAYWTTGEMYGPRYYFEAIGALVILSARGLVHLNTWVALAAGRVLAGENSRRSAGWVAIGALVVLLSIQSWTFTVGQLGHYRHWYGIDGSGVRAVEAAGIHNAVVFVRVAEWTDYAPFFSQNAPSLDSGSVYAKDLGEEKNRELMAGYPDRTGYLFDGRYLQRIR